MGRKVTATAASIAAGLFLTPLAALAQAAPPPAALRPDWRNLGSAAVDMSLASPAGGPVERVWFVPDTGALRIRVKSGKVFETQDFERWKELSGAPAAPDPVSALAVSRPEPSAVVRSSSGSGVRLYAVGANAYRSDDGGRGWTNLTGWRRGSIVGNGMRDMAVSPANPDEVVLANAYGVWRSLDGGLSWSGLNDALPNLPIRRLLDLPKGMNGARIALDNGATAIEAEWTPGEKISWKPRAAGALERELSRRRALSQSLGAPITAAASAASYIYAGAADGRLFVSADEGRTWLDPHPGSGAAVESIWIDAAEPRRALAALAAPAGGPRVLRTMNGGLFWDDLSGDLPAGAAHAVTADRSTGAVYAATDSGLYLAISNLGAAAPAPSWKPVALPADRTAVMDVRLDEGANQIYIALDGYGVFAATAPHRVLDLRVVSAADYAPRAAAPGALLSVLGGKLTAASAGQRSVPVLATTDVESQIQVPFDADGSSLALGLDLGARRVSLGVPLRSVAPAIFVDRDGAPMVLDADRGVLLDAMNPARSGSRVQILATGLGRVRPDWPTGLAAPLDSPPAVVAPVKVYLDRAPIEVTRATLAPGYIGFYLVEVQLPEIVNAGPAELYIESGSQQSNRVAVQLLP